MAVEKTHNGQLFPRSRARLALLLACALSGGAGPVALALASQAAAAATAVAPDCGGCASNRDKLAKQRAAQVRHKEVLAKNLDYLARLRPDDTSKAIKVKSNIVIIQLRLETMQNEISHAGDWIATHGCERCQ
jgi:hypothetical protein